MIALAWLSDAYQLAPIVFKEQLPEEPERSFGNYAGGRWVWELPYAYQLKTPIPVRGKQLLWTWTPPDAFRAEIAQELQHSSETPEMQAEKRPFLEGMVDHD